MGGLTAISPCLLWISLCVSSNKCVHSRKPDSRVIEANLNTIYLSTKPNFAFSFSPFSSHVAICIQDGSMRKSDLVWFPLILFPTTALSGCWLQFTSPLHTPSSQKLVTVQSNFLKNALNDIIERIPFTFLSNQAQSLVTDCPCSWCDCEVRFMA